VSSEKIAVCAPISNRDGLIGEAKEDETVLQAFALARDFLESIEATPQLQ
jgi:hypothetical protein